MDNKNEKNIQLNQENNNNEPIINREYIPIDQSVISVSELENTKTTPKEEVFLHIYDLSDGMASVFSESILGLKIDGIWHTSIEIFGYEYFFQYGLKKENVGKSSFGLCKNRISLGFTDCTQTAFDEFFELSKNSWTPENYDLFENNCNHFTDMVSSFLLNKNIPEHIRVLPSKIKDTPFYKNFLNKRNNNL